MAPWAWRWLIVRSLSPWPDREGRRQNRWPWIMARALIIHIWEHMYVVHVLLACSRVPFVHALPIFLHSYEFSQLVLCLNFALAIVACEIVLFVIDCWIVCWGRSNWNSALVHILWLHVTRLINTDAYVGNKQRVCSGHTWVWKPCSLGKVREW